MPAADQRGPDPVAGHHLLTATTVLRSGVPSPVSHGAASSSIRHRGRVIALVAVVAGVIASLGLVATVVVATANSTPGTPSAASPPAGSSAIANGGPSGRASVSAAAGGDSNQESAESPIPGVAGGLDDPRSQTEIVLVVAVDADGQATSGFIVAAGAAEQVFGCGASQSAVNTGIYRCGPSAATADVCWGLADRVSLLCAYEPWGDTLYRSTADEVLQSLPAVADPLPWGIELSDGSRCRVRNGGSWDGRADGLTGAYSCEGPSPFVLASDAPVFDKSAGLWTVLVGELGDPRVAFAPPIEVAVTRAYFADRSAATSAPGPAGLGGVEVDPTPYRQYAWQEGQPLMTSPGMDGAYFTSPSGNIRCAMRPSDQQTPVICYIKERDFEPPPRPADCPESMSWAGAFVTLGPAGSQSGLCTGDSPVPLGSTVLPYGSVLTFAGYSCLSAQSGVECVDPAGAHGFTLNRAAFSGR